MCQGQTFSTLLVIKYRKYKRRNRKISWPYLFRVSQNRLFLNGRWDKPSFHLFQRLSYYNYVFIVMWSAHTCHCSLLRWHVWEWQGELIQWDLVLVFLKIKECKQMERRRNIKKQLRKNWKHTGTWRRQCPQIFLVTLL